MHIYIIFRGFSFSNSIIFFCSSSFVPQLYLRSVLFVFIPKRKGDEGFNYDLVESGIWPMMTSSSTNQFSDPWQGFTPIKSHDWPATKKEMERVKYPGKSCTYSYFAGGFLVPSSLLVN